MKKVSGTITLPANINMKKAKMLLVEARDVTVMDAASVVIASKTWDNVKLEPGETIPFTLEIPELSTGRSYSCRVHISIDGTAQVKHGDLLSTAHYNIQPDEQESILNIQVQEVN